MEKKQKFKLQPEFYIALVIMLICSIALFFIADHEDKVAMANQAITSGDNESAKQQIDDLWYIDGIDTNHYTVLMTACASGNVEIIEYIVGLGADVNYAPAGMPTPLELYCQSGYSGGHKILNVLFDAGLKQSKYTFKPALFVLADNFFWLQDDQKPIVTEVAIRLLQKGAPMGYENTTLLHEAAKADMDDLFYTIVHTNEGLYMLNTKNQDGDTPWNVAVKNGATGVQKVIRALEKEYEDAKNPDKEDEKTELIPQPTEPEYEEKPTTEATIVGQE